MNMVRPNAVLPQDIIEETLFRLPVKSLLRFKCVSKSCNCLISSSSFARVHLNRTIPKCSIFSSTLSVLALLEYETSFHYKFRHDYPPTRQQVLKIIGYCHGLVAVADYIGTKKVFSVWNPSIGDCRKLPDQPRSNEFINLSGFGYDSSTDDYKVFFCTQYSRPSRSGVSIFSLRKNSWKFIQFPSLESYLIPRFGFFLNGALHWVSGGTQKVQILAFDLKSERFSNLPVPNKVNSDHVFVTNMGILDGRLCLTFLNPNRYYYYCNPTVELWVMKEYGVKESWIKLLSTVDKYRLNHLPLCTSKGNHVISVNPTEKELIRSNDEEELEKFKICNCTPKDYKVSDLHACQAILYAESLVSPYNVTTIKDEHQN